MRIFFLYHDRWANNQAEPILRIKNKLGIDCFSCPSNPGTPEHLWPDFDDSKRRLELDEIYKKIEKLNPDIIITHTRSLTPYLLRTQIPLILLEHTDATALELGRHLLDFDNVLSIVKGSVFSNYDFYNSELYEGMYHGKFINSLNLNKKKPYKKVTENNYKKILLGYSFGAFPANKRFLHYNANKNKKIDISFVGNTFYYRSKLISNHRSLAVKELSKIKNTVYENNVNQKKYDEIMLESLSCLSPYGYGVCYRSFESIYCGCLTIQPYSDFMVTWPNVFVKDHSYLECCPNFSNINMILEFIKDNYIKLINKIYEKREELFNCYFNDEILSEYIYNNIILKSINNQK